MVSDNFTNQAIGLGLVSANISAIPWHVATEFSGIWATFSNTCTARLLVYELLEYHSLESSWETDRLTLSALVVRHLTRCNLDPR